MRADDWYDRVGKVDGFQDLSAHYRLEMASFGKLSLNLVGAYTRDFLLKPLPSLSAYDCVGYFGTTCGPPLPNWRHMLNTTWGTPWAGLDVTVRWRYIGSSKTDRSSPDPQLNLVPVGNPLLFYPQTARIPAYNYMDLAASIPIGRSARRSRSEFAAFRRRSCSRAERKSRVVSARCRRRG